MRRFTCFAVLLVAAASLGAAPPNIVLIFTDDQGYQDVGCFGSPDIQTPHLDRMAAEGLKFTDFYSLAPICSASRAALMTGCYPLRVGITGVLFPRHQTGLNPEESTVAELLKSRGYATACIGKWHLGHHPKFLPTNHGFDRYFGIPYSNDMTVDPKMAVADDVTWREGMTLEKMREEKPKRNWVPLLRNTEIIEYPTDQSLLTKRSTEQAIRFIQQSKDKPFFLYMPHTMPHVPLFASKDFKGKSKRGLYGDVIEEIDWSVGEILAALKAQGLDNNTLVFFTSDNGPWLSKGKAGGSARPLRDGKFSTFEGGMRVPTIARWPGRIPAGSTCDQVAATFDLLPTFAKLAGAALPTDHEIDGEDIFPLLTNPRGAASPHEAFYFFRGGSLRAVRSGKWKLHLGDARKKPPAKGGMQLHDLAADIAETNNIAADHPELVQRLSSRSKDFAAQLQKDKRPAGKL